MRPFIIILTLLTFQLCHSQELDIFQNDSIYSQNKISARTMYSLNGSILQKELVTYYNSAGQKIKQFWYRNGERRYYNVEIFYYSNNGLLSSLIDSSADGNIETTSYVYENGNLKQQVTLYPNNDTCDFRFYPDSKTTIQRWYMGGKSYRYDTTIFEKENIELEFYGTEKAENPDKPFRWHYIFLNQFDSKGNIVTIESKAEKPYNYFVRYIYNNYMLLVKKQEIYLIKKKKKIRSEYYFTYD